MLLAEEKVSQPQFNPFGRLLTENSRRGVGGNDASDAGMDGIGAPGAATDAIRVERGSFQGSEEGEVRVGSRAGGLFHCRIGRFGRLVTVLFVNIQGEVTTQGRIIWLNSRPSLKQGITISQLYRLSVLVNLLLTT